MNLPMYDVELHCQGVPPSVPPEDLISLLKQIDFANGGQMSMTIADGMMVFFVQPPRPITGWGVPQES